MDFGSLKVHFFDGIVKKKNYLAFFKCNKSLDSSCTLKDVNSFLQLLAKPEPLDTQSSLRY